MIESIANLIESLILYDEIFVDSLSMSLVKEAQFVFNSFSDVFSNNSIKETPKVLISSSSKILLNEFCRRKRDLPILSNFLAADESFLIDHLFEEDNVKDFFHFEEMYFNPNLSYNYHILRTIQYLIYSSYLKCSYSPNPARSSIIKLFTTYKRGSIRKDIVTFFDNETRKKYALEVKKVLPSSHLNLNIPLLLYPIVKSVSKGLDLKNSINALRGSPYALEFRKWCRELETSILKNDGITIQKYLKQLQEVALEWRNSLKITKIAFKKIQIKDPFGLFSTNISLPYWNIKDRKKYRPFLFLHSLIKNWDIR